MKFAIIRKECSFYMGGAERYAANLCKALADLGHQVYVLAARCDGDIHPDLIHVPIKVNRTSSWAKNLSFHQNSQEALKSLDIDRVIALSRSFPADAFRVSDPLHDFWMSVRYPGRVHRFLQKLNPRHRAILNLEKGIFDPKYTKWIVTNSKLSKTLIPLSHDFPDERIHVIYNGVDLDLFSPSGQTRQCGSRIELLFVGQDFKRKGLASLIHSLSLVKNSGHLCHLRVVGKDKIGPYIKLAKQLGVDDQVSFEGSSREIHKYYQQADLFVFPSLYDPFANVCLESLACGLPVLTTTTNGSSELIEDGVDGYVVDGSEQHLAHRLAGAIDRFCNVKVAHRETMRISARKKAEKYTVKANAQQWIDLFS